MKDVILTIDVGTGSVRAGLIDKSGNIIAFEQCEHDQITPQAGWSEQEPSQWFSGVVHCINLLMEKCPEARERIAVVASCGQMHGTVLLDDNGELLIDRALLWNDKRSDAIVKTFCEHNDVAALGKIVNNPPTSAWPAFKLAWIQQQLPEIWAKVAHLLMPKDFINFKLTGRYATDLSEASCFYLMDAATQRYDLDMLALFDIPERILPAIYLASDIIGGVTSEAASLLNIPTGTPVIAGTSDFAATLLGSGVYKVGDASDSTGTSTLLTVISDSPGESRYLNNFHLANAAWGRFSILDAGGDAMRWARLALQDNNISYGEFVAKAKQAPTGSNALFFLPYLTGERNAEQTNSKAQFFGLSRKHRTTDLYRAVMEGVAFASKRNLELMKTSSASINKIIASGGGAKDDFWLKIKAAIYNVPIVKTKTEENGVMGCAILGGLAVGLFNSIDEAVERLIEYGEVIEPDPDMVSYYQQAQTVFDDLYLHSKRFYNALERLEKITA